MAALEQARVVDKDGAVGTLIERIASDAGQERVLVRFGDQQLVVPLATLELRRDGSYYLPVSYANAVTAVATKRGDEQTVVIPVIEEQLNVQRRTTETGRVRINKIVQEREEVVDEPLLREQVDVQRVPINRVIDTPAEVRREGDTLIIPILEEVLVVEKRLMLKEEVHVRLQRTEVHEPQRVTLRTEQVEVTHLEAQDANSSSGTDSA